ncbi:hypothetical protein HYH02_010294 [Chlamydomonas schloesseri]|uniref:SRCR domain-containing protein n=1 Tax=Chlamydomonas schloesseri TaxID=2026947 RepID=A0A835TKS7_9CHLO|nr:hypothetical protein HYH02_010294 [Chlamydomonas schloesseri]|eukprot:KAG2440406.1 hypothetical protein HYH02_010294 [Chlamydomonas schloesseri]
MDGSWGSVCELGWQPENTRQACKNLGYPDGLDAAALVGGSAFGSGDVRVVMADVACSGLERYFAACSFAGWGVSGGCDPETQTVGLDCLGNIARSPGPEQSQPPEAAESSPPNLPPPAPWPVNEPVGSPDVPPPLIAPTAPPPRRPPMSPDNPGNFAPPPDETPDAWSPPPGSPPAAPEPVGDDWPPASPPPPPFYDSGAPPPYYATSPPPTYGPYGPPPYGNVPPPNYNYTHKPPAGYPPPGGQPGHQAPPLPPFPPPDGNGSGYLVAGTIGFPPYVRPGPPGALFLELLCPPGFYATAIQALDKDLASSMSLECISTAACADPPAPPPRTIKIHYRTPGCGAKRSRRLRGMGNLHAEAEGKLSSGTALGNAVGRSVSTGSQETEHQLRASAAQERLGSTSSSSSRRARSSRRMLGGAADTGSIIGNAFVLSPARLTDGAGDTSPEDLVVFFGDPMAQTNSEWLDGGEATPEHRFTCAGGFAATRAQAGAQAQPPTRVSFRCDADGAGAGGSSSAGGWTSPELGLGDYGAQVPLSELQCPGGSRLAGLLASTRRVYEGGPLLVEAFAAYCTPACVAQ